MDGWIGSLRVGSGRVVLSVEEVCDGIRCVPGSYIGLKCRCMDGDYGDLRAPVSALCQGVVGAFDARSSVFSRRPVVSNSGVSVASARY